MSSSFTRPFTREAQPVLTSQEQAQEKPKKIYNRTIFDLRYSRSEKGKAAWRRYDQSPKGKATRDRYNHSEKGTAAHIVAVKRYQQSEKGKKTASESTKRRYEARKQQQAALFFKGDN